MAKYIPGNQIFWSGVQGAADSSGGKMFEVNGLVQPDLVLGTGAA